MICQRMLFGGVLVICVGQVHALAIAGSSQSGHVLAAEKIQDVPKPASGKARLRKRPLPPLLPQVPKRATPQKTEASDPLDGPEAGLVRARSTFSFGIQVMRNNGFAMQFPAVLGGSLNAGVGLVPFALSVDYVRSWTIRFDTIALQSISDFHARRGEPLIELGGGMELGNGGYLRLPAGLSYTFKEMPAQVFGHVFVLIGPLMAEAAAGIGADFAVGFRVLL